VQQFVEEIGRNLAMTCPFRLQTFALGRQDRLSTLIFVAVGLMSRKNYSIESESMNESRLLGMQQYR